MTADMETKKAMKTMKIKKSVREAKLREQAEKDPSAASNEVGRSE